MIARRNLLVAALVLTAGPALALDPGTASGHYARDGVKLTFSHAIALSQDNTEGLLDNGPQVRVVLSDVEVPVAALYGAVFPPVNGMARKDAVHGVMLEFSPKDPKAMHVTVLSRPQELGASLTNISLSNSQGVFKKIVVTATRVTGEYDDGGEGGDMKFSFSAPVFTDPVQADLRGPDAQKSPQVQALIARAEAIGRGDLPAALALSSQGSDLRGVPAGELKQFKAAVPEMLKGIRAIKRVVVRRETAVALMGDGGFSSLVLEGGAWKVAD
ncbi:hypothetical protein [Phenylobacterium sp.]|uniref:hypothetical protein n=1 Tax=Phenylobacterium sp. TaxID=1871053 RepID=UPI0035690627